MYLAKSRILIEVSERDKMSKIITFTNKVVVITGAGG
ncbi:D-mannonate oxidoreductase, partial [Streptococcus agalactiae]